VSISNYYERVRKLFVLGAALALLATGCGSSNGNGTTALPRTSPGNEAAARAVVRVQAQLRRGEFAAAWRTLHPAEKRVISASRLAACYPADAFPRTVTFRAIEEQDVSWEVPGTNTFAEAKEVTVKAESAGKTVDTFKQHTVRVGPRWTWMLSRAFFNKARAGGC
jgi:hypothetical protein